MGHEAGFFGHDNCNCRSDDNIFCAVGLIAQTLNYGIISALSRMKIPFINRVTKSLAKLKVFRPLSTLSNASRWTEHQQLKLHSVEFMCINELHEGWKWI